MHRITLAGLVLGTLIYTGCTTRDLNNEYKSFVNQEMPFAQVDPAKKNIDETIFKMEYLDMSSSRRLSDVLEDLSKINRRSFYLRGDDIMIPEAANSELLRIDTFAGLRRYVEDTTNYALRIDKNRYVRNRSKVVSAYDKESLKTDLSAVSFRIDGIQSVSYALRNISNITGFNVIYSYDNHEAEKASGQSLAITKEDQDINPKMISYNGNNVGDFLNYLQDLFNVYVDIDYQKKIIKISKYQRRAFDVLAMNYEMEHQLNSASQSAGGSTTGGATTSGADGSGTQGSNLTESPVSTKDTINAINNLEERLKETLRGDENSFLSFDKTSGNIVVKTTRDRMADIEEIVSKLNKGYETQIKISIDVYHFLINKDYNFGIGATINSANMKGATQLVADNLLNKILSMQLYSGSSNVDFSLDSKNTYAKLVKTYNFTGLTSNNMPKSINSVREKEYTSSISVSRVTGTTTPIQDITTEKDKAIEGAVFSYRARAVGNKIFVVSNIFLSKLNDLKPEQQGENTIYHKDERKDQIPSSIVLNSGERRIVGYFTAFERSDIYEGVVPLDGFVLGGTDGVNYVRSEFLYVLSAHREN